MEDCFTISDLAEEFGVTTRTIRFYEEKELISPLRSKGNQRRYGKRDRTRLKLILRGKKFGLKLDEISEIIGLANFETNEKEQLEKALEFGKKCFTNIENHIAELNQLKEELYFYGEKCQQRLDEIEGK